MHNEDRPKTLPAKQLRKHFAQMADHLGVHVDYYKGDHNRAESNIMLRTASVVKPYDVITYYTAMHELGHVATTPVGLPWTRENQIGIEAQASAWAATNGIVAFDATAVGGVDEALLSYVDCGYAIPTDPADPFWAVVAPGSAMAATMKEHEQAATKNGAYEKYMFNAFGGSLAQLLAADDDADFGPDDSTDDSTDSYGDYLDYDDAGYGN